MYKTNSWQLDLGAHVGAETTTFRVWAPHHLSLLLKTIDHGTYPMHRDENGMFTFETGALKAGDRYLYILENGFERPDPVSRALPCGIHGPTEIVNSDHFSWEDHDWKGIDLWETIFYETHIGTFTPRGTFEGVIDKLAHLKDVGINCIEIMPIAQFPGRWNWGYDGASLYAPYIGYGGVEGLKTLVNAAHQAGIAVCLDVVYNHLGPEGNYLSEFGPYLSETYHTPWGRAFNYDGAYSDEVRAYVVKNALHWIVEYHIDMLRLDAIHGIYDFSASPMLSELVEQVDQMKGKLGRKVHIIAETGLNDSRVVRPQKEGGVGLCALWNDDFHHAAHVALTGERTTYLEDFNGLPDLAKALKKGFVYDGQYSSFRKRRHGNRTCGVPFERFIVFLQNHDQIGNRPFGERLSTLVGKERAKAAAPLLLMTPAIPMLFMGEEYGEEAPFEYFVDYENEKLMRSIFDGRKREFGRSDMPFPGKESFDNSTLTWKINQGLLTTYRELIVLRRKYPPNRGDEILVYQEGDWLAWEYPTHHNQWIGVICNFGEEIELTLPFQNVSEEKILFSTHPKMDVLPSDSALIL